MRQKRDILEGTGMSWRGRRYFTPFNPYFVYDAAAGSLSDSTTFKRSSYTKNKYNMGPNKRKPDKLSKNQFGFLKSKISYGAQSNQKIEALLKSKISNGAQSNQKIEIKDFL